MTREQQATTVLDMQTRIHKTQIGAPAEWDSMPYSELRKRNERRARVAELLKARRQRLERIAELRSERKPHHGS